MTKYQLNEKSYVVPYQYNAVLNFSGTGVATFLAGALATGSPDNTVIKTLNISRFSSADTWTEFGISTAGATDFYLRLTGLSSLTVTVRIRSVVIKTVTLSANSTTEVMPGVFLSTDGSLVNSIIIKDYALTQPSYIYAVGTSANSLIYSYQLTKTVSTETF